MLYGHTWLHACVQRSTHVIYKSFHIATILPEHWETYIDPPILSTQPYKTWLKIWNAYLVGNCQAPKIPSSACQIHKALRLAAWRMALSNYPNQKLAQFFIQGISEGFRIGYNRCSSIKLKPAKRNLEGARQHPEVVDEYLAKELALNRIAGLYKKSQLSTVQISRFGVIPKRHQQDSWRLIVDLSHPKMQNINDDIPKDLCRLTYITVDDAIHKVLQLGPNTLLAKIDIKSAFRLMPIYPADRHLLAMEWRNGVYLDIHLPFGISYLPDHRDPPFLAVRGNQPRPLFILKDSRMLTRQLFSKSLDNILDKLHLNYDQYNTHSFRIGAATSAKEAGIDDLSIKMLGRWHTINI